MKASGKNKYWRCIMAAALCVSLFTAKPIEAEAEVLAADDTIVLSAETKSGQAEKSRALNITADGVIFEGNAFLYNNTTYVAIRQFATFLGANSVFWEKETGTAIISADGLLLKVKSGAKYMEANGRTLWMEHGSINDNGTIYVPIRVICSAFGYSVSWNAETRTAAALSSGGTIVSGSNYYDSDSVKWLSRIIHAEAEGESLLGKIAVGNVVLNRKNSSLFPNTIYGVIFDRNNGVQFTPTVNGAIYNEPNEESIIAAKLCLEGVNIMPHALFFVNVKTATNSWVSDNRECITVIGNHSFFA